MNFLKTILVFILAVTLPISQAYAVVPDVHSVISDVSESNGNFQDINLAIPGAEMFQSLTNQQPSLADISSIISSDPLPENIIETEDVSDQEGLLDIPLVNGEGQHFWTRGKIIAASAILFSTGLLLSLIFVLSGAGSGSGSSSGSGSGGGSGGNPNPPDPNNPNLNDPNNGGLTDESSNDLNDATNNNGFPLIGGGTGPGGEETIQQLLDNGGGLLPGGGNGIPGGVPHHPEPSTFLLMGLGLLVPFLRKRFSL